jgi:hypothetical protein
MNLRAAIAPDKDVDITVKTIIKKRSKLITYTYIGCITICKSRRRYILLRPA